MVNIDMKIMIMNKIISTAIATIIMITFVCSEETKFIGEQVGDCRSRVDQCGYAVSDDGNVFWWDHYPYPSQRGYYAEEGFTCSEVEGRLFLRHRSPILSAYVDLTAYQLGPGDVFAVYPSE